MSDAVNKKTYTAEELFYQDLNDQNDEFVARINERQEEADCVSTNTANKVVKRDSSGNFSAGTITANLTGNVTGNVTGNADTATLADAAKGDTRFPISGNFIGGSLTIDTMDRETVHPFTVNVPVGKTLRLKRSRFHLSGPSHYIALQDESLNVLWANNDTQYADLALDVSLFVGDDADHYFRVSIWNNAGAPSTFTRGGWYFEFSIE
jgi:hypothetical protein